LVSSLFGRIADPGVGEGKLAIGFGQAGAVVDGHDPVLPPALPQAQPGRRGVGDDVPSDGFCGVLRKGHPVGVRDNLIRDEDGNPELLGKPRQLPEELAHLHLALRELPPAGVVRPIQGRRRVDHQQGIPVLGHDGSRHLEEFHLVLRVVSPGTGNVFEGDGRVEAEALGDRPEALGPEGTLGVDVNGLSLGPALVDGHLAGHAQGVTELGLSGPELSKDLSDGSGFDASLQELVDLYGSRGEHGDRLAVLQGVSGSLEFHRHQLLHDLFEFQDLGLGDPLDIREAPGRSVGDLCIYVYEIM
jgi:hypothetical protein